MGNDVLSSSNSISGFFYNINHSVVQYFNLKSFSDSLILENAQLRNQLASTSNIDTFQDLIVTVPVVGTDSASLRQQALLPDSVKSQNPQNSRKFGERKIIKYADYHYIPAKVINNTLAHDKINFITINRGAADGIEPNMAVVTYNGIIGRVVYVTEHFATVVTILSEGRSYNARLMDGNTSMIKWDVGSSNAVTMERIQKGADVQIGDTVFTTEHSIFPEGIMIGTVAEIEDDERTNSKNIRVLLSTNFRNLDYVYVVKNDKAKEKDELEQKTRSEINKPVN